MKQGSGPNVVWDSDDVLEVLHRYKCVVAVIAGHDHDGDLMVDEHGIHHIIMPGVIETAPGDQAYASVHVYENKLELRGTGSLVPNVSIHFGSQGSGCSDQ